MQLWNINSFKQIYHTILRKNANQCVWVRCTNALRMKPKHSGDLAWHQSPWPAPWTTASLSAINPKEVAQCGEVHANSPPTSETKTRHRMFCFTDQIFLLPSARNDIKNRGKADRHMQRLHICPQCNPDGDFRCIPLLWQHDKNLCLVKTNYLLQFTLL